MVHATSEERRQLNQKKLERVEKLVQKFDRQSTIRCALILCGAVPFFFFLNTSWAHAAMLGYVLTAMFFGLLLVGDYPPLGTRWFWKAMIPIVVIHVAVIAGLVWINLSFPEVNRLPRMLYGYAASIVFMEWWLSRCIINWCQPK